MDFRERERIFRAHKYLCEWCRRKREEDPLYRARHATDVHHALIRRDARFPEMDTEENYCIVCHVSGEVDTPEFREWFWRVQCLRYGDDYMREWVEGLPLKVKPMLAQV